jgi:large subunit GTPase 1
MRSSQGNPDEARAARYILKDYVNGKLLFCNSPPGISSADFNEATHARSLMRAIGKKRAPATRVTKNADTFVPSELISPFTNRAGSVKSKALDQEFFEENAVSHRPHILGSAGHGKEFTRLRTFPHQNMVANDGSLLDPQQARLAALSIHEVSGKKHHKKMKRGKQRSGKGYGDD